MDGESRPEEHSKDIDCQNRLMKKRRLLPLLLLMLLTLGAVLLLLTLLIQPSGKSSGLKIDRHNICGNEHFSVLDVNACSVSNCSFAASSCEVPCPFDYLADERGCPASCECADHGFYQGDIQFDSSEIMDIAERYGYISPREDFGIFYGSLEKSARLWMDYFDENRYKIPYDISPDIGYDRGLASVLNKAMVALSNRTCIDFVTRTDEYHYILIINDGRSCSSFDGLASFKSPQTISLAAKCHHLNMVAHELMHVLGLSHEHVRPDRDAYLNIMWENIQKGKKAAFKKLQNDKMLRPNVMYDAESTLQFSSDAFAASLEEPSMLLRDSSERIFYDAEEDFSAEDIHKINAIYGCLEESYRASWAIWGFWSLCDQTCGDGERHRYRKCMDAQAQYVTGCHGEASEVEKCDSGFVCPGDDHWLPWGPWGECIGSCGSGHRVARRKCVTVGKCGQWFQKIDDKCDPCAGRLRSNIEVSSSWELWSACSSPCNGLRTRGKICYGICLNFERQIEPCNTGICYPGLLPGIWSEWGICDSHCTQLMISLKTLKYLCPAAYVVKQL